MSDLIDIIVLRSGQFLDRATADTPENALCAARTLWDENLEQIQGQQKKMAVYFLVDDQLMKSIEGRRP